MYKLGIDIGSRNTKIVLFHPQKQEISYYAFASSDISVLNTVNRLISEAYTAVNTKASDIDCIGVTGYGRKLYLTANSVLSEISCHAAGCRFFFPTVRGVIDIGGQDAKVISIDIHGKVTDFVMNDKCAAGTGRFLEMTAHRLGCEVSDLSSLAEKSKMNLKLNSTCVVFAESEIIGMMATATKAEDIARAVHISIVRRIAAQVSSLSWVAPVVFTGGVAKNIELSNCLGEELGLFPLLSPKEPEITGALGAAILAKKS